ncbi:Trafficking protein particle complex subunit 4 [Geodia barretti]|uniref:Trafficking protein particle complex subunit n=2 Tax=Geodia barretti TaxID=519541 RepID=A0AA35SS09_GEOBA|nr:Trafficking protein particle complex subunit 4 [Geodia barretti]
MGIISVYIVSKAGGLIFSHDQPNTSAEVEATFNCPLGLVLEEVDRQVVVKYGEKHGIQVGYSLVALNGQPVANRCIPDGTSAMTVLTNPENYPVSLKFARLRVSINERIMLLSMFHSIYAISVKLSPAKHSSGIQCLEADSFKFYCFQTITGVKFIVVADNKQQKVEDLLKRIYELYADFVLKNPFYSLDMPIRCEHFSTNLTRFIEEN